VKALLLKTLRKKCSFTRSCQTSALAEVHFTVFDQRLKNHTNPKKHIRQDKTSLRYGGKGKQY